MRALVTEGPIRLTNWAVASSRAVHDVRSSYVERCWLPLLGPSTLLLFRHSACVLDASGGTAIVELGDVARSLGLGGRGESGAPLRRTIARAVDFQVARVHGPDELCVRRDLPELTDRQLRRLPTSAITAHRVLRIGARSLDDPLTLRDLIHG